MKPRISQAAMDRAERLSYLDTEFLRDNLKHWLQSIIWWKREKALSEINLCRKEIIEDVMALEIKIKRPHWYRRPLDAET